MHPFLLILFALAASCTPTTIPKQSLNSRALVPYPGPIPYQNPSTGLPNQQSVTDNVKASHLTTSKDAMKACLVAYGSYQFYDSWQGNVCGGLGWFKGSTNDKIDPYDCYQTCASWLEENGIENGASDYQCDFRVGMHGHCWMGYHPVAPESTPSLNAAGNLPTGSSGTY